MEEHERAADLFRESRHLSDDTPDRLERSLTDPSALVRHVAAIALAGIDPDRLPEPSIRELLDTLVKLENREPLPIEESYIEATVTEDEEDAGALGQDIALALASLRCGQADFAIPRLLAFWAFDSRFYELAYALLGLTFPVMNSPVQARSLSQVQNNILDALLREPAIWSHDLIFVKHLSARGLPQTRQEMQSFVTVGDNWPGASDAVRSLDTRND
jgi:hypothetical protein